MDDFWFGWDLSSGDFDVCGFYALVCLGLMGFGLDSLCFDLMLGGCCLVAAFCDLICLRVLSLLMVGLLPSFNANVCDYCFGYDGMVCVCCLLFAYGGLCCASLVWFVRWVWFTCLGFGCCLGVMVLAVYILIGCGVVLLLSLDSLFDFFCFSG